MIHIRAYDDLGWLPDQQQPRIAGAFVADYDPEAHAGLGAITFTDNVADAIAFPTVHAALEFINQQPRSRPLRDDGKPNKPITSFHLELVHDGLESVHDEEAPSQAQ